MKLSLKLQNYVKLALTVNRNNILEPLLHVLVLVILFGFPYTFVGSHEVVDWKTAVNRMDGGGALMQLRFERSLKLDDDMKLQWLPLDRKGSKRLYRLVREMAEGLASSRS